MVVIMFLYEISESDYNLFNLYLDCNYDDFFLDRY